MGLIAGIPIGMVLGFLGHQEWTRTASSIAGTLVGLLVAAPLSAAMALRKRDRGFRLQLVRDGMPST